jgi:hypothetical protein
MTVKRDEMDTRADARLRHPIDDRSPIDREVVEDRSDDVEVPRVGSVRFICGELQHAFNASGPQSVLVP